MHCILLSIEHISSLRCWPQHHLEWLTIVVQVVVVPFMHFLSSVVPSIPCQSQLNAVRANTFTSIIKILYIQIHRWTKIDDYEIDLYGIIIWYRVRRVCVLCYVHVDRKPHTTSVTTITVLSSQSPSQLQFATNKWIYLLFNGFQFLSRYLALFLFSAHNNSIWFRSNKI